MMRAVAVIRVPPDWLPFCTASLMSPAHDRYIGPYRCVTKQFIVIYAIINAMGKCCAHTYVHSGFCKPLFLCISASIKPSHKEVMGFHGPLEKLCANPERTEWEQGLSAPVCLEGAPPNTLIHGRDGSKPIHLMASPGEPWDFPRLSWLVQRGHIADKDLLKHCYLTSEVVRSSMEFSCTFPWPMHFHVISVLFWWKFS